MQFVVCAFNYNGITEYQTWIEQNYWLTPVKYYVAIF